MLENENLISLKLKNTITSNISEQDLMQIEQDLESAKFIIDERVIWGKDNEGTNVMIMIFEDEQHQKYQAMLSFEGLDSLIRDYADIKEKIKFADAICTNLDS